MNYRFTFMLTLIIISFSSLKATSQKYIRPLSLEVFVGGGIGEEVKTGIVTSDFYDIMLSVGGGRTLGLRAGYRFSCGIEAFLGYYSQKSFLDPPVSNGSGSFSKSIIHPMVTFSFQLNERHFINTGAGLRISYNNLVDLDASEMNNPVHNKFYYNTSFGPSVYLAYQLYFNKWSSFILSSTVYYHKYKLNSLNKDGIDMDISTIPDNVRSSIDNLNGSGIEITAGLRFHL
ncbi:MAG: hypothetical protein IPH20_09745 [Bacteroidales bacterium]|nr:hypothetical protein [Bacteroidales bacterium]